MRVGITGTREGASIAQMDTLDTYLKQIAARKYEKKEFHHGDCVGVDAMSVVLALDHGYWVIAHPPTKDALRAHTYSSEILEPKPYLERNRDIVDAVDLMFVLPAEEKEKVRSGTWSTYRYAKKQKVRTIVIYPSGGVQL